MNCADLWVDFQAWPKDGSICCNSQQSDDNSEFSI